MSKDNRKMMKKRKSIIQETAKSVLIAFVIAMAIRTFVVQAFKIPSGSMEPTLLIGDHILADKFMLGSSIDIPFTDLTLFWMPGIRAPRRRDVIIFKYPRDPKKDFIKRVIGVGGDAIASRDKHVYVNGHELIEPYVQYKDRNLLPRELSPRDNFGPIFIPRGYLFVMGDDRDESYDSRFWGPVDVHALKGQAFIIYWSWDRNHARVRLSRIGMLIK
jgi:signal peptidase I